MTELFLSVVADWLWRGAGLLARSALAALPELMLNAALELIWNGVSWLVRSAVGLVRGGPPPPA